MLNAGREGTTDACQERGAFQIGNVRDWYPDAPDVFIASAIADVSMASVLATEDSMNEALSSTVRRVGLEVPEAVSLAMAPTVPSEVKAEIEQLSSKIISGEITIPEEYDGVEFKLP